MSNSVTALHDIKMPAVIDLEKEEVLELRLQQAENAILELKIQTLQKEAQSIVARRAESLSRIGTRIGLSADTLVTEYVLDAANSVLRKYRGD